MTTSRDHKTFWTDVCARATAELRKSETMAGWSVGFTSYDNKAEREALEAKANAYGVYDAVWGYFDQAERRITVCVNGWPHDTYGNPTDHDEASYSKGIEDEGDNAETVAVDSIISVVEMCLIPSA